MSNQEESNPMNVDANVLLDDYKKQVGDLDLSIKVKDTQIKNFQRENQRLRERVKSLQEENQRLQEQAKSDKDE